MEVVQFNDPTAVIRWRSHYITTHNTLHRSLVATGNRSKLFLYHVEPTNQSNHAANAPVQMLVVSISSGSRGGSARAVPQYQTLGNHPAIHATSALARNTPGQHGTTLPLETRLNNSPVVTTF